MRGALRRSSPESGHAGGISAGGGGTKVPTCARPSRGTHEAGTVAPSPFGTLLVYFGGTPRGALEAWRPTYAPRPGPRRRRPRGDAAGPAPLAPLVPSACSRAGVTDARPFCAEDSRYAETFRDTGHTRSTAESGSTAIVAMTRRLPGMVMRDGRSALIQPGKPAGWVEDRACAEDRGSPGVPGLPRKPDLPRLLLAGGKLGARNRTECGRPRAGTRADRPGQRLPAHPQHRFIGLTSDLRARCITVRSGSSKDLFPNGPWLEHSSLNSRIRAALASLQAACGHGFEHAPVLFGGPWNDDGAGRPEQGGHPFAGPGPEQPPRGARTGPRPGDPGTYSLVASRTSRLGAVTVGSPIADLHCSPPPLPCVSPLEGPNPESACRFPAAALIWPFHCSGRPVPLPRDLWP